MYKNILVIGATGMLGKPVTTELTNAGFVVSAMVRDPEKAAGELPPSVRIIRGDLKNAPDIENALEGMDAVYLNLSVKQTETPHDWHSEKEGLTILLAAAKRKNIKRISFLSSLVMNYQGMNGFKWWVFELKHNAIKMIKEAGIPYTIYYPSNFMESLFNVYKQKNKMMLAGKSIYPMYFIAAKDYGKQVAQSLQTDFNENKEYVIQGPEAYTAEEAVAVFLKHYVKEKMSIMKAPIGMLKLFGLFNTRMNYGWHIIEALNNYPEKFAAQATWKELGKPETTVAMYAASLNIK